MTTASDILQRLRARPKPKLVRLWLHPVGYVAPTRNPQRTALLIGLTIGLIIGLVIGLNLG